MGQEYVCIDVVAMLQCFRLIYCLGGGETILYGLLLSHEPTMFWTIIHVLHMPSIMLSSCTFLQKLTSGYFCNVSITVTQHVNLRTLQLDISNETRAHEPHY